MQISYRISLHMRGKKGTLLVVAGLRIRLFHVAVEYMTQFPVFRAVIMILRFDSLSSQNID